MELIKDENNEKYVIQYIHLKECYTMRKKVLAILTTSAVFMVMAGYGISFFLGPSEEELAAAQEVIDETFHGIDENITQYAVDEILFQKKDMNEAQVQDIIHSMSHQKVKADQKWGSILITKERIGKLIKIVEANYYKYEFSDIYLDILNRWYVGDFSKADKDHNEIWTMQGGTIGKAKGLLNAEEERKFISGKD